MGNVFVVNDDDHARSYRDEIAMRNFEFSTIREAQREGIKTIAQALFDLIYDHARN